jgi:hypothetical protein
MSALDKARDAHGVPLPDWIHALAKEVDATSQNRTAARLECSASMVSAVLGKTYKARTDTIEERVRGVLMSKIVACPMLGEIGAHLCQTWRARQRKGTGSNSFHIRMAAACRACPRNADKKGSDDVET